MWLVLVVIVLINHWNVGVILWLGHASDMLLACMLFADHLWYIRSYVSSTLNVLGPDTAVLNLQQLASSTSTYINLPAMNASEHGLCINAVYAAQQSTRG